MKKLTILFGALLLVLTACEDKPLPFPEFEDLEYGAYARRTAPITGVFNYFDVENSAVTTNVEFYDENKGRNVASYAWTVSFVDRTNNGANNRGPVPIRTYEASQFTVNSFGLPSTDVRFTFPEALNALGLTRDNINGGDQFVFQAEITKTDGTKFSAANTQDNLVGQPAFNALFTIRADVVCPSDLAGTYNAVTVGTSTDVCCPGETTVTGTVTLAAKSGKIGEYTISDWSGGLYPQWYEDYGITPEFVAGGGLNQTLIDACNNISINSFSEPFGESASASGAFDPATGIITYTWINGYGDTGTVTLTPQ